MASEEKKEAPRKLKRPVGKSRAMEARKQREEQAMIELAKQQRQAALLLQRQRHKQPEPRALADDDEDGEATPMTMEQVILEAVRMRNILSRFFGIVSHKLPFRAKNGYRGWFILDSLHLEHLDTPTGKMLQFRGRARTDRDAAPSDRVWVFNSLNDIPDWLGGCLWPEMDRWVPALLPPGEKEKRQMDAAAESMKDIKHRIMAMVVPHHTMKGEGTMTIKKNDATGIDEGTWTTRDGQVREFLLDCDTKTMKVYVFGSVPDRVGGVFNMLPSIYDTWMESTAKPRKQEDEDDDDVPQIDQNELAKFVDYHLDDNGMWRCTHCDLRWSPAMFYNPDKHKCFPRGYVPRHSLVPNNDPRNKQMARFGVRSHSTWGTPPINLDLNPPRMEGPYAYDQRSGTYTRVPDESKMEDDGDAELI